MSTPRLPGAHRVAERLADVAALDAPADWLAARVSRWPRAVRDVAHGVPIGTPLHPILTDVTIGCWTAAFLLGPVPGSRRATRVLLALGVLSAVPTAAAGVADWHVLDRRARRVGFVHLGAMAAATGLYAVAWRRARRSSFGGPAALLGATVATVGAHFGGSLVYRFGAGVSRPPAGEPLRVRELDATEVTSELRGYDVEGARIVATRVDGRVCAFDDRCPHLGGPLSEGSRTETHLRCPWHGSEFRLTDGAVLHGPATAPLRPVEIVDGAADAPGADAPIRSRVGERS